MGVSRDEFWHLCPRELGAMRRAYEAGEKETWRRTLWTINYGTWGGAGLTLDDVYARARAMSHESYERMKERARNNPLFAGVKGLEPAEA